MPDLLHVTYEATGQSTNTDAKGMREMQARAYAARSEKYLLLKAPPASGKSRALMFIALDKLANQGLKKAIIAVPERSIGGSFENMELSKHGFPQDWVVLPEHNLCTPGVDKSKVSAFKKFLVSDAKTLVCTHATLRFAYEELQPSDFDGCMLAIDEFHHVAAGEESRLGNLIRGIMNGSSAHIVAMTGSYFRGDSQPVLSPEDEARFKPVTYNYYEQLNGYNYLKALGIGYHFYQGRYLTAIDQVLDTDKKTILHIPNVNSGESTKAKHDEVDLILDMIGETVKVDPETGVIHVRRHKDGKIIKVADLVNDDPVTRDKVMGFLRSMRKADDMDLIIALGMAKEGFDWEFCEHALTVGYRGSLTEIIQIIGRCTRDSAGKAKAQFTNLISKPDATDANVTLSVNNMLKAITCSLLMEQVLAPVIKFKPKGEDDGDTPPGTVRVKGLKGPTSDRVKNILENDINDLKASILADPGVTKAVSGSVDPEVLNKVMIPKIIETKYPDLTDEEREQVRQHVVVDALLRGGVEEVGDKRFIRMAGSFVNIDDLSIDLIDQINPFQRAYEILSKEVNAPTLKVIQEAIAATRIKMSDEEAILLFPKIKEFKATKGRDPNLNSPDPLEQRMASAIIHLQNLRRQRGL